MNQIHPTARIHHTAIIGPNVYIGENSYIGPYCTIGMPAEHKEFWPGISPCSFSGLNDEKTGSVIIGDNNVFTGHVTIDAGTEGPTIIQNNNWFLKHSHVGHDAVICDEVTISCGVKVGGHAIIGSRCNLGLNAVIHQKQKIKEGCMIGMGSVVTKKLQTEPYKTYAGNPAKLIGENTKHPNYTIFQSEYP
jgi:UDP-N-acetylglucosamine acyltransferase